MKVHELIALLERFDPEYEVEYPDWENGGEPYPIGGVYYHDSGKAVIE